MRFLVAPLLSTLVRLTQQLSLFEPRPAPRARSHEDARLTRQAAELLRTMPGCDGLADKVVVRWNARLRSTAGQACGERWLVTLNPRLTEFPGEVDRTLRHELAHLAAFWRASANGLRAGRRRKRIAAHGPEWRQACAELGIAGEPRCHQLPLPRHSAVRRHTYRCPSCTATLRRVREIPRRRPLACLACCRRHAGGRFDRRFLFVKATAP